MISDSTRRRNPQIFGAPQKPAVAHDKPPLCRTKLNKTEERAWGALSRLGAAAVWGHATYIPLSDGDWYVPDFTLWPAWDEAPIYIEVKGSHAGKHIAWSERGIEKYKRARAEHPHLCFVLLTWRGGAWEGMAGLKQEMDIGTVHDEPEGGA